MFGILAISKINSPEILSNELHLAMRILNRLNYTADPAWYQIQLKHNFVSSVVGIHVDPLEILEFSKIESPEKQRFISCSEDIKSP